MADVFFKTDAQQLLKDKHIVFFGDSNARAIYKDFIFLLNHNQMISQNSLRRKQEPSFCGDRMGNHSDVNRGRDYEEERSYRMGNIKVEFYFITRCYSSILVNMMEDIRLGSRSAPDVIYVNSTLWDMTRWGPNCVVEFKDNLQKLARLFKFNLPPSTLVIWATALPVSNKVRSSLLIKQIDFLQHTLRFDIVEANHFARQVMVNQGFDVLDNHFYMRMQMHRRVHDGVHYFPPAIRLLTNLLLTHIALSWNKPLPNRVSTILLDKTKALCSGGSRSPSKSLTQLKNSLSRPPLPPRNSSRTTRKKLNRKTPYERNVQNYRHEDKPHTLRERLNQLRRLRGGDRRYPNRRSQELESSLSESADSSGIPWPQWLDNNWTTNHWHDNNTGGQMFDDYYSNNILSRSMMRSPNSYQRN